MSSQQCLWLARPGSTKMLDRVGGSLAPFTPQVLRLNSNFLLRSDFLFGCSHYFLKCGLYQIPVWTLCGFELTRMCKRAITMTSEAARCCTKVGEVTKEASIFTFISKCLCNGSRNINEQVLRRRRMKRKRAKWAILAFCGVKKSYQIRLGCSHCSHIEKNLTWVWFRTTYGSGLNLIWKNQIWARFECSHYLWTSLTWSLDPPNNLIWATFACSLNMLIWQKHVMDDPLATTMTPECASPTRPYLSMYMLDIDASADTTYVFTCELCKPKNVFLLSWEAYFCWHVNCF